jgi:hypothetical protein
LSAEFVAWEKWRAKLTDEVTGVQDDTLKQPLAATWAADKMAEITANAKKQDGAGYELQSTYEANQSRLKKRIKDANDWMEKGGPSPKVRKVEISSMDFMKATSMEKAIQAA